MSHPAQKECVRISLDTGEVLVCTADHPWLTFADKQTENYRLDWTLAKDLLKRPNLIRPFLPWETETSWESGWLAGMLDGEGCICRSGTNGRVSHVSISQNFGATSEKIAKAITSRVDANVYRRNGSHHKQITVDTRGGMAATAKLIGQLRAERLIEQFDLTGVRVKKHFSARVVAVEPVGIREIQSIQTTSGTYIAEGFACHNTNYPERLDKRFVDRPSRFDTVAYIGMPTAASRAAYLKAKEPSLSAEELERWVGLSEDLSIAHLKEMIIAVCCLGQDIEDVAARLHEMHETPPKSTNGDGRIRAGFAPKPHWGSDTPLCGVALNAG
ncbi:MAG: hypothetical protein ACRECF_04400 [Methyloceanibacter sp.]